MQEFWKKNYTFSAIYYLSALITKNLNSYQPSSARSTRAA